MSGGAATKPKARRPRGSLESAAPLSRPDQARPRAPDRDLAPEQGPRAGPHRRHRGLPGLDGAPGLGPPRAQPPRSSRPGHSGPIRRIEMSRPGELVHSTSRSWAGSQRAAAGGSTARGRAHQATTDQEGVGYAFVHSAVDGYSRLAYSEVLADERPATAIGFWRRAQGLLRRPRHRDRTGPHRQRQLLSLQGLRRRPRTIVAHTFTRPYRPATNGKVERFNRTLLGRVGLRPTLDLRGPTNPRACPLAPHLQPSPTPHRHRRTTGEPCRQPGWFLQLVGPSVTLPTPGTDQQTRWSDDPAPTSRLLKPFDSSGVVYPTALVLPTEVVNFEAKKWRTRREKWSLRGDSNS